MPALVPNRFLFRFELPLRRWTRPVRLDADLTKWEPRCRLPALCKLDGQRPFGEVFAAWHESGLLVACRVRGKRRPLQCDPVQFRRSDHLRLMTDMRDARDVRRATRFCQQFYLMPAGGGRGGREPVAGAAHIARAREDAPIPRPGRLAIAARARTDGYDLEAHLPADALSGFDPVENPRIGLFYILEDRELGQQSLTIGDDLNWWLDPSTWATGVLSD